MEKKVVTAGGHAVVITHPDKVLFSEGKITKMELVEYYLSVGQQLASFGTGRPVAFKRYPHGESGDSFFQKNKPEFAPDWMTSSQLGVEKKANYIVLDKVATLLWLVNLDALEFHTTLVAAPNFTRPDLMVFDLDPPPGVAFTEIRDFALACRPVIESFGYRCFVKTSGKRGVHICCPIRPQWGFEQVFNAAREVARAIIDKVSGCTLKLKKEDRQGKILIDIYRNHPYQLMALPLGTRATPAATVSMPLSWEELSTLDGPAEFTVRTVVRRLKTEGFAWKGFREAATELHLS